MTLTLESARAWYDAQDAVHGFDHIARVYKLCERIGKMEGADMVILLAAALLHDSQGGHPQDGQRNDHHLRSAEFAGKILEAEGWSKERVRAVQDCIRSHRYRHRQEAPQSLEAKILFDADKLDVLGAVGVVRTLAYAFQDSQPAYAEPSKAFLADGVPQAGEQHSAYHEYVFKLKNISATLFTNSARKIAAHRQQFLDDFFEELAEEMRGNR